MNINEFALSGLQRYKKNPIFANFSSIKCEIQQKMPKHLQMSEIFRNFATKFGN